MVQGFLGILNQITASIAISTQASTAIDLKGFTPSLIIMPAAFTGTALTFQVSSAIAGTYVDLYNSSGLVSVTVAAGRAYAINPADFYGVQFLKVKSGSSEAAARSIILGVKGF